jgi:hypothetical protein
MLMTVKFSLLKPGDMTQMVEHLLCKDKALKSNSSPTKKKRKVFFVETIILSF